MAKLTDKSALITPANDDLLYIVDVNDTTDSAQGTSKKIELQNLIATTIPTSYLDTDGTLSANSDTKIATQKATKTYADTKIPSSYLDTDGTLTANSDTKVATQKATKTYADTKLTNSMTTERLLGRGSASTGVVEEIQLGTNLILAGTTLNSAVTFRNILINGDMSVAQRSASTASITTTGYYTADRWEISQNFGTVTQSVENDAPTGTGLRKSLKNTFTTGKAALAAGDLFNVRQKIEGLNLQNILKGTASAKKTNLSFWVKSNVTGTYIIELFDNDNTRQVSASYSILASNTWEFKTINFPADTTGAFDNDNLTSLVVQWCVAAGTDYTSGTLQANWGAVTTANRYVGQVNGAASNNNFFQITGIQLEIADEASEFEKIPYDINLQRCLRYCYVLPNSGTAANSMHGQLTSTTAGIVWKVFPVKMRATPTSSNRGNTFNIFGSANTTATYNVETGSTDAVLFYYTTFLSAGAVYQPIIFLGTATFSAEL